MRILFIVNPSAGKGSAGVEWPTIEREIGSRFSDYEYSITERPGHATEIARDGLKRGLDVIVSCGGDGTLNEVINGVAGSDVRVGLVPLGTGSDFGKTIGIRTVEDSLNAIAGGFSEVIDIGSVRFDESGLSRNFVNILEIGFGAEVMKYVNSHSNGGRNSFTRGVFSVLMKLKKFKVTARSDRSVDYETIEVIVANGRYFGGGMLASPDSSISDGLLDVHVLKPVSKLTTILRLKTLMNGTYIGKNYSFENRVKTISFEGNGNLVEMDGEVVGTTPISIEVAQKGLNFLVPSADQ